jgi:uncharacterized protein YdaL
MRTLNSKFIYIYYEVKAGKDGSKKIANNFATGFFSHHNYFFLHKKDYGKIRQVDYNLCTGMMRILYF